MPDVPITYQMEDYLSAKDLELEWVLRIWARILAGDRLRCATLWETDAVHGGLNMVFGDGRDRIS